jgi:hypothetical protein
MAPGVSKKLWSLIDWWKLKSEGNENLIITWQSLF